MIRDQEENLHFPGFIESANSHRFNLNLTQCCLHNAVIVESERKKVSLSWSQKLKQTLWAVDQSVCGFVEVTTSYVCFLSFTGSTLKEFLSNQVWNMPHSATFHCHPYVHARNTKTAADFFGTEFSSL